MMLRAARLAEAGGRASGARASAASGAFSATAAACETRGGVRPRADAGARRWVSGDAARGGESASEAATRPASSSSASSSSASPEALVRAGRPLEFGQAAELVFAAHRAGRLGWDWHAWHFVLSLVPAGVAYAWAQHILATDPEIRAMVEASGARGGEARLLEHGDDKATTVRGGDETRADALDDVRRRLARLETALAATARDGDEKTSFLRETPRVSQPRASASPRTTDDANRRILSRPTTSEKRMNDSGTPEPPPSRWRRAWRETRRFSKRLFRDDASEGE
jgi:hypothetical protein